MEREIQTISFGKACRIRRGMYLSADDLEALHLGLREIYVNSLDALTETEQKKGNINITIDSSKRQITVVDNGPGIPIKKREDGSHSLVAAYVLSHTGSHFDGRAVNSIGQNGVGGSIVNHTAESFSVTSNDGKLIATAEFISDEEGAHLIKPVEEKKATGQTGVSVTYIPDKKIYHDVWFDRDTLINEITEMMKFYPKYTLTLNYDNEVINIAFPKGLKDKTTSIYYESENLIMALNTKGDGIKPYGNRLYLPNGGAFFTHFKTQLTKTINAIAGLKLTGAQVQSVFGGYLAIFVNAPLFSNQSKTALSNKEVNTEISDALRQEFTKFAQTSEWDRIIKLLEAEMKAAVAAEKARERILKAQKEFSAKKINAFSEKFIDSDHKKREECDLYLAEGDSAGGPIKRTKPNTAAVMLLRGKVLNVARTDFEHVVNNNELMMIAKGLGATLNDNGFLLNSKNLRFGKIIIAADSDEDGAAIEALLLTYFYKYFPQLIKEGKVYGLAPRLFKIEYNNKSSFFRSEKEMEDFIKDNKINRYKVSRYKGLGSFDDDEFKVQIDPNTRELRQFTITNAARAAKAITLMEEDMESRRALIKGEFEWEE